MDALRGWAILGVMLTHAGRAVPDAPAWERLAVVAGGWGVQLFFVVSAFTLFGSLDARGPRDRRPAVAFAVRRAFRLVPLFWVGILYYAGHPQADRPVYAPDGVGPGQVLATAALVHAWWPTAFNSVVPGGWSIGVEAMFYLAVPPLHRAVRSLAGAVTLAVVAGLGAVVAAPAGVALLAGHYGPGWRPLLGAFVSCSPPVQFVVFCGGIVLHFILRSDPAVPRRPPAAWVLLAAGLLATVAPGQVTAAVAFTLAAWGLAVRPFGVLVNRATAFVGRVSYSGYLWHFCLLSALAPRLLPPLRAAWGPGPWAASGRLAALYAVTVAVTLPVAWVSYRVIERPWIAAGRWVITATGCGPQRAT